MERVSTPSLLCHVRNFVRAGFRNRLSQFESDFKGLKSGVEISQTPLQEPLNLCVGTQVAVLVIGVGLQPLGSAKCSEKMKTCLL